MLLAGLVGYTMKATRSLDKPNNIFVANYIGLICDVIIRYINFYHHDDQLGMEPFISCYLLRIKVPPVYVGNMSFVIIAVDKVIVVTFPFKNEDTSSGFCDLSP